MCVCMFVCISPLSDVDVYVAICPTVNFKFFFYMQFLQLSKQPRLFSLSGKIFCVCVCVDDAVIFANNKGITHINQ